MTQTSPETETLVAMAQAFVDRKYVSRADARQKEMGLAYVEAERKDLAREIVRFIQGLGFAQQAKEPIDKKALLDIMNGYLVVHARRDGTFEIRGADKAAEAILLVIAHSDTSTVLKSEKGSPVGWGGHLPGRIEP
jgi:hypothetical protein